MLAAAVAQAVQAAQAASVMLAAAVAQAAMLAQAAQAALWPSTVCDGGPGGAGAPGGNNLGLSGLQLTVASVRLVETTWAYPAVLLVQLVTV